MKQVMIDNIPKTILEKEVGDFIFNLNDIGELRITNKYEPTTFVLEGEAKKVLALFIKYEPKESISPIVGIMGSL